ncbi:hypothetical protein Anapl_06043 [Anas platyrhynchos]|uniref:Uncharacterized protein n=1 Tax=Anas platyrhynchos TaxID=8839 RepID=R0K7E5_ANAPL|nr:hypothetical protein Anapl_06043 [Anas platyrhynchos]
MTKRQEQARSCTEKNSHTASFCEGRKSPSSNPKDNQKGAIEAPCLGSPEAMAGRGSARAPFEEATPTADGVLTPIRSPQQHRAERHRNIKTWHLTPHQNPAPLSAVSSEETSLYAAMLRGPKTESWNTADFRPCCFNRSRIWHGQLLKLPENAVAPRKASSSSAGRASSRHRLQPTLTARAQRGPKQLFGEPRCLRPPGRFGTDQLVFGVLGILRDVSKPGHSRVGEDQVGVWELELDGKAWYEALASDPKRDAGSPSAASQNPAASLTSFPAGAPYKHRAQHDPLTGEGPGALRTRDLLSQPGGGGGLSPGLLGSKGGLSPDAAPADIWEEEILRGTSKDKDKSPISGVSPSLDPSSNAMGRSL